LKRNIKQIPLTLLKLDQENVRFGGDVAQNQREAIELMMADPDDAKKILRLAEHIAVNGLDPTELQLVAPDNVGTYTVLEGNRRLTALKLLVKPDLCPDEKLLKGFFAAHAKLNDTLPNEIDCAVVNSRKEGDIWIELKHTGQNNGVGRVDWNSDIRDERRARQTGIESIGRQIRELIKDNSHIFSPSVIKDAFSIPVTTLTRLFSSTPAQTAFAMKIENKELVPTLELKYIAPAVEFAVQMFVHEGYNVNDIRSDIDRQNFVKHIPPELDPRKRADQDRKKMVYPVGEGHSSSTFNVNEETAPYATTLTIADSRPYSAPSARARKYLIPWSLNIRNSRINEIYRELRKGIEVNKLPNAAAITFRVFIEVTCDSYIESQEMGESPVLRDDNSKQVSSTDRLSIKVRAIAKHLEKQGLISMQQFKALFKRASSTDSVGSIDHFNLFVHGSASAPLPSELKDIADEYKPLFEAIWK
jgi:hypothetical protein